MSIWPPQWYRLKELEAAGELVALPLRITGDPAHRALFLTPELCNSLLTKHAEDAVTRRYVALRARLETFVTSEVLTNSFLKPLKPYRNRVWEIVDRPPRPSLRVFGLFVSRDVFLATNHQRRSVLGEFASPEWKLAMRTARYEWRRRFIEEPMPGTIDQVISGAAHV